MGNEVISIDQNFSEIADKVEKVNERSSKNNKHFKDQIKNSTATSMLHYQEGIKRIKDFLNQYYTILQNDISNLRTIKQNIESQDKAD